MKSVSQIAKECNVSPQAVYKKVNNTLSKSLKKHIKTVNGKKLINEQGEQIIKDSFIKPFTTSSQQVNNGSTINDNLYEALIKQLEEKDKQIEALQKLVENAQVLQKNEQQKVLLLSSKKNESWIDRIFKKTDPEE